MRNAQAVVSCSLFLIFVAGCGSSVRTKNAGVPTGQAVAPTGIWRAQDVAYGPWTLTLQAEGDMVKGTVRQERYHDPARGRMTSLTEPVEIYDGTIRGNTVSFKCNSPGPGDRTITFIGQINGDEITFARNVQVRPGSDPGEDGIYGASGASHFVAKRDSSVR
jgi:hypothetical protein